MWRCPHCDTSQAEAVRCWACSRSPSTCGSCRHFRTSVATSAGYCANDRRRLPIRPGEVRPCWEEAGAVPAADGLFQGFLLGAAADPVPAIDVADAPAAMADAASLVLPAPPAAEPVGMAEAPLPMPLPILPDPGSVPAAVHPIPAPPPAPPAPAPAAAAVPPAFTDAPAVAPRPASLAVAVPIVPTAAAPPPPAASIPPPAIDRSPFVTVPDATVARTVPPERRRPGSPVMPVSERHAAPEVRAAIASADPRPTGFETAFLLDEEAARGVDLPTATEPPAPLAPIPSAPAPAGALRPVIPVDAPDTHELLATVREEDGSIAWAGAASWPRSAGSWRRIDGSRPFGASSFLVDRPTIVALGAVALERVRSLIAGRRDPDGELGRSSEPEPYPETERSSPDRPYGARWRGDRAFREPANVDRSYEEPAAAVPSPAPRPAFTPRPALSGRSGALREAPHVPGTPAARSLAEQLRPSRPDGVPTAG